MTLFNAMKPRSVVRSLGKKRAGGILILLVFMLFFYGPLLYMFTLAFANTYNFPSVFPTEFGFRWWEYVMNQPTVIEAIVNSFLFAFASTILALIICIPAAYVLARFKFRGRKFIMLLFLIGNAFPKIGMYTSIGIIYYKIGLMGTFLGVLLIHMLGTMMQMIWLPAGAFRSRGTRRKRRATRAPARSARFSTSRFRSHGRALRSPRCTRSSAPSAKAWAR